MQQTSYRAPFPRLPNATTQTLRYGAKHSATESVDPTRFKQEADALLSGLERCLSIDGIRDSYGLARRLSVECHLPRLMPPTLS